MTQPTWKYRGAAIQLLGLTLLLIGALQLGTELASWFTSGFMMHLGRLFWGLLMASAGAELFALRESGRKRALFIMVMVLLALALSTVLAVRYEAYGAGVRLFGYEYRARSLVEFLLIMAIAAVVPVTVVLFLSSRRSRALLQAKTKSEGEQQGAG